MRSKLVPVIQDKATGKCQGIEAVIDKDRAACMMGISLKANGLLILTDVTAVATDFATDQQKWIKRVSPETLQDFDFPDGSMGPKVESAIEFVQQTNGWAAIGSLNEAENILTGKTGTRIEKGVDGIEYHSP